jgi:competence protein ComEA
MSRSDRILLAACGAAVVLAGAALFVMLGPGTAPAVAPSGDPGVGLLVGTPAASVEQLPQTGTIFIDVEGAVAEPGIRELPAGSRIADAIAAAGGYASDADLVAAAATINLAQPLSDGEQVWVPHVGAAQSAPAAAQPEAAGGASAGSGGGSGGGGSGGLVDLNTATPEELEALPGIGPVTVQKIVAAREERPFTSLQDAVDRGVIHRGQLEDIEGVATAG